MDPNTQADNRKQYSNRDVVRVNGKFPCLECDVIFRLRWQTIGHMVDVHNIRFVVSARTIQRQNVRIQSEPNPDADQLYGEPNVAINDLPDVSRLDYLRKKHFNPSVYHTDIQQNESDEEGNSVGDAVHDIPLPDNQNRQDDEIGLVNNMDFVVVDDETQMRNSQMPLYTIGEDDSITDQEHVMTVSRFSERYQLSETGTEKLLHLLKLHMPKEAHAETNMSYFKKNMGFNPDDIEKTYFCLICGLEWNVLANTCSDDSCTSTRSDYFTSRDLIAELKLILTRKGMWQGIQRNKMYNSNGTIQDVIDGEIYQQFTQPGQFLEGPNNPNLTLTVNSDGISLFKSSGVAIWAIYAAVNEIPIKERFARENILLHSCYQGTGKPDCKLFFGKFASDMKKLFDHGFTLRINGVETVIKVLPLFYTQDLPARAFMMQMRSHGAKYCCLYCEIKGRTVHVGKGKTRHYDCLEIDVTQRTMESILAHAEIGQPPEGIMGFIGRSPIYDIPHFDFWMVCIDYMHLITINICATLFKAWFVKKKDRAYIGQHRELFNTRLLSAKPCKQITRLPRVNFKEWKASENRAFLLLYSLHCLEGLLDEERLNHLALLVEGTHILLSDVITQEGLERARICYELFLECYDSLYGPEDKPSPITLNMHGLTHLVKCVQKSGNLQFISCFAFESYSGQIVKQLNSKQSIKHQIFWNSFSNKMCANQELQSTGEVQQFMNTTSHKNQHGKRTDMKECAIYGFLKQISIAEQNLIQMFLQDNDFRKYRSAQKIVYEETYYDCKLYTRIKRRVSYYAELKENEYDCDIAEIQSYIVNTHTKDVFPVAVLYKFECNLISGLAPSFKKIRIDRNDPVLISLKIIKKPIFIYPKDGHKYISILPNIVEKD